MKRTETYRVAAAALRAVCQSLANVLFAAANPVFAASVVVFIPFIGRARVQPLVVGELGRAVPGGVVFAFDV